MPTVQIEVFDLTQILSPMQRPEDARIDAVRWGANLTITKGQAGGIKTSDGLMYPLNRLATDGTQTFKGLAKYSFVTDASSNVFYGPSAAASFRTGPWSTSPIYRSGIFSPTDLITASVTSPTAEIDTITATTPTTGDVYTIYVPSANGISYTAVPITVGGTQTAAAVVALQKTAWDANATATALASYGAATATFVLTSKTPGQPMNLVVGSTGTGNIANVVTTPAVAGAQGEVDTFTATNPTTGDVYTLTYTNGAGETTAVSATVGATQTATAIDTLLIAAWNADPVLGILAVASGTTTLIITASNAGQPLNIAPTTVGTGTMAKVVTKPASGRNFSDIAAGAPGSRVLHNGFWDIV